MNTKPTLFDNIDPAREAEADARAEQDVREGRLISHDAVRRWLLSWVEGRPIPRPKIGD
jgi:predicted transcriptional regulator